MMSMGNQAPAGDGLNEEQTQRAFDICLVIGVLFSMCMAGIYTGTMAYPFLWQDWYAALCISAPVISAAYVIMLMCSVKLNRCKIGAWTCAVWNANLLTAPAFIIVFSWLQSDTTSHRFMMYSSQLASIVVVVVFACIKYYLTSVNERFVVHNTRNANDGKTCAELLM
jgi:hypothetical protein